MNKIQLQEIMDAMKERYENMTADEAMNLSAGDGLLSVLETTINESFTDETAMNTFWQRYQSTSFEGTPCEAMRDYTLLYAYWSALTNLFYFRKLKRFPEFKLCGSAITVFVEENLDGLGFKDVESIKFHNNGNVEIKYDYEECDRFGATSYTTITIPSVEQIIIERRQS